MPDIKIEMDDHGRGRVFMDGVEIKEVRSIKFASGVGAVNLVTLELIARRVSVNGPANVVEEVTHLDSGAREFKKVNGDA